MNSLIGFQSYDSCNQWTISATIGISKARIIVSLDDH